MSDTKISQLSSATTLTGTEVLPIVQSSQTVQTPVSSLYTVPTSTFSTLSNNITEETVQASAPTCLYLKDGTSGTPNSTTTNPPLWIAKYVSKSQTVEGSQQVSGAFIDVEVKGSGSAASPTKGAYIGTLSSVNTLGTNTGTSLAPTWDTKGDTVGMAGFACNSGVPGDGHIVTGVWGWACGPTLDATTYANLAAANWSIVGFEANVTVNSPDVGVKTSLNGNGSSAGYLCNNYRTAGIGQQDMTFGYVLAGTPNDADYTSTTKTNWNGYHTGILVDKCTDAGIYFGSVFGSSAYGIKFATNYGSVAQRPAAGIYMGDTQINMGSFTGTATNGDFYYNSNTLFIRANGVTEQIVTNRSNVTTAPGTVWTFNDTNATALFSMGSVASAVNNFKTFSAATAGSPALVVQGTDSNIGMELRLKGSGIPLIVTSSSTTRFTVSTAGVCTAQGYFTTSVGTGLTAAGSTQGTALALAAQYNEVTTAAASTGVILPTPAVGVEVLVFNRGANTLNVYPPTSGQIDAAGVNTAVTIAANGKARYVRTATNQWYTA